MTGAMTTNQVREQAGLGRVCACGCGTSIENARKGAKYANAAHRTHAYRLRKQRAGKPSQRRHRTPDMRIAYAKALEAIAEDFVRVGGFDLRYARRRAAETLHPLLSDKQRAHLQERGA